MKRIIKVDFSDRGKSLHWLIKQRKEEKKLKRTEFRIARLTANR